MIEGGRRDLSAEELLLLPLLCWAGLDLEEPVGLDEMLYRERASAGGVTLYGTDVEDLLFNPDEAFVRVRKIDRPTEAEAKLAAHV